MTIGSVTGANATAGLHQRRFPNPAESLTSTAQLLGISTDDLATALRSGTKLSDLAAEKNVSKDDLVKSIAADLKANAPAGAPALDETQLTHIATNIADGKRPSFHHGRHHRDGESVPDPPGLSAIASALDMNETDLLDALEKGTNLADLATQKGTTFESLLSTLRNASNTGDTSGTLINKTG